MASAGLQAPFRQRVDQTDLTCVAPTAQDPPQTRFGKIPSPFWHGLPVVRREQDVLTLLCESEYLHYKHRSDSCRAVLEQDNGRRTRRSHVATSPRPLSRPALEVASHQHRWIDVPGHDAERRCPRDLQYQRLRSRVVITQSPVLKAASSRKSAWREGSRTRPSCGPGGFWSGSRPSRTK